MLILQSKRSCSWVHARGLGMPTGRKALSTVLKWPTTLRSAYRLHDPSQIFDSQMMTVIVSHRPKSRLQLNEKPVCEIVSHSRTVSEIKASYLAPDGREEVRGPATTIVKSFTKFLTPLRKTHYRLGPSHRKRIGQGLSGKQAKRCRGH